MIFSVPTVDTTRTTWLLEQMLKIKCPVVLVGESGTSKTATTQNFLSNLDKDLYVCMRQFALFVKLSFHSLCVTSALEGLSLWVAILTLVT